MKIDFSHIFRNAVVSVLLAGLLAHLFLPFSSDAQKTAFTRWLDHNVVSTGDETELKLRNTIRGLPEKSGNLFVLIQEASELISNHKEEFKLKHTFPENSEKKVTSWLVGQWNIFQHQKSGTDAILPDAAQSFHKWISYQQTPSFLSSISDGDKSLYHTNQKGLYVSKLLKRVLSPLTSGISINAP